MDKNIKIHIKDRVAVAEGDPVIICGNSDYTVTFSFDEEWGQARAKTARFKFNTAEGPEHLDQPFEGDTVAVPELSNVREVEVGVFVGDLNTTTGASIRCKPCIRCGSGAPKDPDPDVYDELMALINKMGGTGGGLPVVNSLPTHPEVGDVVILRQTKHIPWDQVKVWNKDEVAYNPDGIQYVVDALPSSGRFKLGEIPEKLDLSRVDKSKLFACGVVAVEENRFIQVAVGNIYDDQNALSIVVQTHNGTEYTYHEAGAIVSTEGWYVQDKQGHYNRISAQEVKLPELSSLKFLDMACMLPPSMLEELESIMIAPDPALDVFSQLATITNPEGIYKAEEHKGTVVWELWIENNADALVQILKQVEDNTANVEQALKVAEEAQLNASTAKSDASTAKSDASVALIRANGATTTANEAVSTANNALSTAQSANSKAVEASRDATKAAIVANNNTSAISDLRDAVASLQTEVDGYSTFLEEINGEVVDDE